MVIIRGEISVNSPTALAKFRNRANSMNGSFCNIILTKVPTKHVETTIISNDILNLTNKLNNHNTKHADESTPQTPHETREKEENPAEKNEKSINKKLGRLVYTTKEGDTFEAYHSFIFPKIVCDGVVYENKDCWRNAMLNIIVEPRRLY